MGGSDQPSSEWFPEFVRPENFYDYWNDVDGVHRRTVARHWLANGFDSDPLRWLAELDDQSAQRVTTEQLIAVLHSLGVVFEMPAEFMERCHRAIATVQVDLDGTGFQRFQMRPVNASGGSDTLPSVYAALPGGSWYSSGSPLTQNLDDPGLVIVAAESITDTLVEVERVFWPTCVRHPGPPMTLIEGTNLTPGWRCHRGDHLVAELGRLTESDVVPLD